MLIREFTTKHLVNLFSKRSSLVTYMTCQGEKLTRQVKFENSLSSFHNSSSMTNGKLIVDPLNCLHDESVSVKVEGLSSQQEVTLTSTTEATAGPSFFTYSHYRADKNGQIDLSTDESVGGTWRGLFPMGPIANLLPGPTTRKFSRFVKKDVGQPLELKFRLLNGHHDCDNSFSPDSRVVLDSVLHTRAFLAPGVQRIPVRSGRIRGTLFLPEGVGPFPGVIDVFGTAGGLLEFRSSQLAARGIAALSLAYFDFEDLPAEIKELDIEYFEEAVDFLLSSPRVKREGVAVIGVSKGGDVACSMGTFIPGVKCVICINGISGNIICPMRVRDKTLSALMWEMSRAEIMDDCVNVRDVLHNSDDYPETIIPMHESSCQFNFFVSLDDQSCRAESEAEKCVERMKSKGKHNFQIFKYKGAGHFLEPPFSPHTYASFHKAFGVSIVWGGNAKDHCQAQIESWNQMIQIIKKALT